MAEVFKYPGGKFDTQMDTLNLIDKSYEVTWDRVEKFHLHILKLQSGDLLETRYPGGNFDTNRVKNQITVRVEDDGKYHMYHFVYDDCHGESVCDEAQVLSYGQLIQVIQFMTENGYKMSSQPYEGLEE